MVPNFQKDLNLGPSAHDVTPRRVSEVHRPLRMTSRIANKGFLKDSNPQPFYKMGVPKYVAERGLGGTWPQAREHS